MSCETQIKCKDVPECTSTLALFTAPDYMGEPIYVYVENLCNGHIVRHEGTVNYEAEIEIDLAFRLNSECAYKLWINDELETPNEKHQFEIGTITTDSVQFGAFKFFDENYDKLTGYTSHLTVL